MKVNTIQASAPNKPSAPQIAAHPAADAAPSFRETLAHRRAHTANGQPHNSATQDTAHAKTADKRSTDAKAPDKPATKTDKARADDRQSGQRDHRGTDKPARAQADTQTQPARLSAAGAGQAKKHSTSGQPSNGDSAPGDHGKATAIHPGSDGRAPKNAARATGQARTKPDRHGKTEAAPDRDSAQTGRPDNAAQPEGSANGDGHGSSRQTDAGNPRAQAAADRAGSGQTHKSAAASARATAHGSHGPADKDKTKDTSAADTPAVAAGITVVYAQTRGNTGNAPGADRAAPAQDRRAAAGQSGAGDSAKHGAAPDTAADSQTHTDDKYSARLFDHANAARPAGTSHDTAPTGAQSATPHHAGRALTQAASPVAGAPAPGAGNNAATPLAANLAPPVGTDAWQQALGQQALRVSHRGGGQAQLTLHPANLGKLHVSVDMNQQAPQIHFASPHADVRAAVQSALPQLRDAFTQAGIDLGGTSVGEHAQRDSDTSSQHRGGDRANATATALGEHEPAADTRITAIVGRTLAGGIDIFA